MSDPLTEIDDLELGLPFTDQNMNMSQAKLNNKSWLICDADFATNYQVRFRGMPVRIIGNKTNGIFKPDRSYFWSSDASHYIEDTGIAHQHDNDTDAAGGRYRNILHANANDYYVHEMVHPAASSFYTQVTGGSTVITTMNGTECVTDGVTNNFAQARLPGGAHDLKVTSAFVFRGWVNSGVMFSAKLGVGMENVSAAEPLTERYGLEACDAINTARTWNIASGDGSAWSMVPTSELVERTEPQGMKMLLTPLQNITYTRFDQNNFDVISIKDTNVPGLGWLGRGWVWSAGIRTNQTTEKRLIISALRVIGKMPEFIFAPGPLVVD